MHSYLFNILIIIITHFNFNINNMNCEFNFICNSGALLNITKLCDGRIDCYDSSDETQEICYHTLCPLNKFKCNYGACIKKHYKCNGIKNCADDSDEMQCGRKFNSCRSNEYRCKNGKCILSSNICDGINDCKDNSDETTDICKHDYICPINSFRCNFGGCIPIELQCDGFQDCLDASDEAAVLCLAKDCLKCRHTIKCKPFKLSSMRIDVYCEYNKHKISCYEPIIPGTKVIYTCREYFIPVNLKHEQNYESICQMDGTWSNAILECKPDCGKLSSAIPLIVNGWELIRPFPWHANIYVKINNSYRFWCGATLISEAVFITAAHCLWKLNNNDVKITQGTVMHHYQKLLPLNETYENDSDDFVKIYTVKRIIIHPLYLDKFGNYGSDIALIEINENVEFNEYTLPICIDWELDDITSHLTDQNLGYILGMGITESDIFSDKLRVTSLPVISNQKCLQKQRIDFRKFITFTTFCAGWANGTGVCNGDSGGGFIFFKNSTNQWCLQGIVSLSPRRTSTTLCDPFQYTIFTKVGIYVKWLKNNLNEIHSHHNFTLLNEYDSII